MDQNLEGMLQKQGERGLKGFKKRYMVQKKAEIFYYKNKNDSKHIGSINLVEALRIELAKEGKTHFKIYTPRRIWHLVAENEEAASYWVNGVTKIIAELKREDDTVPAPHRASVRMETMENRIRDLESTDDLLKRALALAAAKAGVSVDELLKEAEASEAAVDAPVPAEKSAAEDTKTEEEEEESNKAEEPAAESEAEEKTAEPEPTEAASSESASDAAGDSQESAAGEDGTEKPKKFQATVLYDYTAQQDYEMTIKSGETIAVLSKHGNGWWLGATGDGKQGYFPGSYVEPI
eukprot:CAMPEP_0114628450 /NCGR_PEP_ID=MMETSP0168-20121206/12827_1 /TAXON_ID=95228 ORGANISM="Vannella sp., Strain DIVA3 517/6/12" /NCGR_SAMPLE_ID=MMETSP0168 /ASSEMBLY_ACC=CAM_ASM_000044 /LENGTH=292 /DNA_ID=CAMNT_0001839833 /DNA_START=11 /DNA_END=889 /DNA_ORIENTATION=-